jgi:hypothetical protein
MVYDQNFWDNKWPKSPIVYRGRALIKNKTQVAVDVKDFITTNDNIVLEIIRKFGLKKPTLNETAWTVQKWVVKFLTYKYDSEYTDCEEFWMFPFESLQSKIGDCEDGAILIATLCIAAGIPAWRIKVAAGFVQEAPTAPTGGHAYCIYLADRLEQPEKLGWVILDWCFFEDSTWPVEKKPLAKDGGYQNMYKSVWWTFNNQFSWNQTALSVDAGRISGNSNEQLTSQINHIDNIMNDIESKINNQC